LDWFPNYYHTYLSENSIGKAKHEHLYLMELLNTLTPSSAPPHELWLKFNHLAILLYNMNDAQGQANGTHMIIQTFMSHVFYVEIIINNYIWECVFISQITLIPSENSIYFKTTTISNKTNNLCDYQQGIWRQTIEKMGLFLLEYVYSHGQLYVALLQIRSCYQVNVRDLTR
jgi:hypothetical protein